MIWHGRWLRRILVLDVAAIRRDLKAAGVDHTAETGELVDFHALRTTAICWWLDVYGLSAKRVRQLARLKTISLVERYSRKLRIAGDAGWLSKAPVMKAPAPQGQQRKVGIA